MSDTPRIARIYFSLRTAHLERFKQLEPSTVIYRQARYDFDPSVGDPESPPQRLGRLGTIRHLLTHTYDVVEVNEPAIAWLWADLLLQTAAIRTRSVLTRRHTAIVTYCIGLVDPAEDAAGRRLLPSGLVAPLTGVVMRTLVRSIDRLAFGTTASRDLYVAWVGRRRLAERSRLFEALPSACGCMRVEKENYVRDERSLVFVGAFSDRKGIGRLMSAWEAVGRRRPDLRLTMIGKGEREDDVRTWAAGRPEVTVIVDPPRDMIHQELRRASCAILLSQRVDGWREQVGLPIVEALAHGCQVITTDETGLAPWLRARGHGVVRAGSRPDIVAAEVLERLDNPRAASDVLRDLPTEDQRLAADRWMVSGDDVTQSGDRPERMIGNARGGEHEREGLAKSSGER